MAATTSDGGTRTRDGGTRMRDGGARTRDRGTMAAGLAVVGAVGLGIWRVTSRRDSADRRGGSPVRLERSERRDGSPDRLERSERRDGRWERRDSRWEGRHGRWDVASAAVGAIGTIIVGYRIAASADRFTDTHRDFTDRFTASADRFTDRFTASADRFTDTYRDFTASVQAIRVGHAQDFRPRGWISGLFSGQLGDFVSSIRVGQPPAPSGVLPSGSATGSLSSVSTGSATGSLPSVSIESSHSQMDKVHISLRAGDTFKSQV